VIKLSGTWHVPDGVSPEEIDAHYFGVHVPNVRRLPKLTRHVVLKSIDFPTGTNPRCWRSAEIWFDSRADFDAAIDSPEWAAVEVDGFMPSVGGLIIDVFDVEDEYLPAGGPPPFAKPGGDKVKLIGTWHVPDTLSPPDIDDHYFAVHVPNVRRLPKLERHVVLRAVEWPAGTHTRCWRGAEIWFDSRADFDAAIGSPEWAAVEVDGFMPSVGGLVIDVFHVEHEWTPEEG
jgi:uncharacterized protein (TIGR02118 family)